MTHSISCYEIICRVRSVKLALLASQVVQVTKVIWVAPDQKEVKVCKVLAENLANLVFQEKLALQVQLVKMVCPEIREVRVKLVVLELLVFPVLVVLLVLLVALELLVPRVIQESLELLVSREKWV